MACHNFYILGLIPDCNDRIILATIKNMGLFPCPRCHIAKKKIYRLGKASDMAQRNNERKPTKQLFAMLKRGRRAVFRGSKISGPKVEGLMGSKCRIAVNVIRSITYLQVFHSVLIQRSARMHSCSVFQALMCMHS